MQGMMKKMGISQEEIECSRVIIEGPEKNIIIENPSVSRIKMQGNESFQISGDVIEEEPSSFSEEDIALVIQKTGKDRDDVVKALEKNSGDIAQTIVDLN